MIDFLTLSGFFCYICSIKAWVYECNRRKKKRVGSTEKSFGVGQVGVSIDETYHPKRNLSSTGDSMSSVRT